MTDQQSRPDPRAGTGLRGTQAVRAAASGWAGSALEFYDFFVYAQAAALVFPRLFFDTSRPGVAIIASLGTYGVGYLMRPIGAFVLGSWGDRLGRKHVLVLCMVLMGIGTVGAGLLPTYQQVGIWAPILLVVLRMVQGFAVAGEISGASSMILEHAPYGRRGFLGSFALQGTQFGQILAAAIFLILTNTMDEATFLSWGWRVPFLLGAVVLVVGVIIRRTVEETPVFEQEKEEGETARSPIGDAFRFSGRHILLVFLMALMNVIPVTTTIFGATFATNAEYGVGLHESVYLWIPTLGNVVAVIVIPFVGNLSDLIGRRPCFIVGALSSGLLSFAYLRAIAEGSVPLAILLSILMWGMLYQGYNAVFPSFFPELFRSQTRVTGMAIAQNLGTMVSSLAPSLFVLIAPPGTSDVWLRIGGVTFLVTAVAALAAFLAPETYLIPTSELGAEDPRPVERAEYLRRRREGMGKSPEPSMNA